MKRSDSIGTLASALAKAQSQIQAAPKTAANPFFKSHYADLAAVIDVLREPFANNGIAWVQFARATEEGIEVETMFFIRTESGAEEFISEILALPVGKYDPQGIGSAITYAKRYSLQAMAGIPSEDDDGNAAAKSAQHSAAANGANSRARAAAAKAQEDSPPPPETPRCSADQQAAIRTLIEELKLTAPQATAILKPYEGCKRFSWLTPDQAKEVILGLLRKRTAQLLTATAFNLDDVRRELPDVKADTADELTADEADAVIGLLRETKARQEA